MTTSTEYFASAVAEATAERGGQSSIDFDVLSNAFGGYDLTAADGSGWRLRVAREDSEVRGVDLHVLDGRGVLRASASVAHAGSPETVAAIALLLWEDAAS